MHFLIRQLARGPPNSPYRKKTPHAKPASDPPLRCNRKVHPLQKHGEQWSQGPWTWQGLAFWLRQSHSPPAVLSQGDQDNIQQRSSPARKHLKHRLSRLPLFSITENLRAASVLGRVYSLGGQHAISSLPRHGSRCRPDSQPPNSQKTDIFKHPIYLQTITCVGRIHQDKQRDSGHSGEGTAGLPDPPEQRGAKGTVTTKGPARQGTVTNSTGSQHRKCTRGCQGGWKGRPDCERSLCQTEACGLTL